MAFATLQEDREAKCKAKIYAVCADNEDKGTVHANGHICYTKRVLISP
jgi:hypothetical protein